MRKWSAILATIVGLLLVPVGTASAAGTDGASGVRLHHFAGTYHRAMVVFRVHGLRGCAPAWGRVNASGRNLSLSRRVLNRTVHRHVLRLRRMWQTDLNRPNASLDIACMAGRSASVSGGSSASGGPEASVAGGPSDGSLVFNGTFDQNLSNYSAENGACYSMLSAQEMKFSIDSSCNPGQDGLFRTDLNTRNIYPAGVPECTSIPINFPRHVEGVTDNTWLMFAETEDPYNPNQNDWAGWGMYLNSYYNGNDTSDPNQYAIAFADYNHFAPAWTSSANVDSGWHTLSLCTNDANDNTGVVYGIWLDGVRQTFNHGPQAGSQTLSGFPIIQNDQANSTNWPLIINDYTGGAPFNELIHGAPLVSRMGADATPPQPDGGWNSP